MVLYWPPHDSIISPGIDVGLQPQLQKNTTSPTTKSLTRQATSSPIKKGKVFQSWDQTVQMWPLWYHYWPSMAYVGVHGGIHKDAKEICRGPSLLPTYASSIICTHTTTHGVGHLPMMAKPAPMKFMCGIKPGHSDGSQQDHACLRPFSHGQAMQVLQKPRLANHCAVHYMWLRGSPKV